MVLLNPVLSIHNLLSTTIQSNLGKVQIYSKAYKSFLSRWVLYHLSHTPGPFCFSYFSDKVLCFRLGLNLDHSTPTYASHVAGITDVHHMLGLLIEMGGVSLFPWAGLKL
jgi:hypothetical protein